MAEKGEYREVFVPFVRQKTHGRELVNTERGRTREGSDFSAAARAENPLPQNPNIERGLIHVHVIVLFG